MDKKTPFRRSRRTPSNSIARVVEPGHPGTAAYQVLDISHDGLFVADEQSSLSTSFALRIGLPNSQRPHERVWAWGSVAWHGEKDGRRGVGISLSFDAPDAQRAWVNAVSTQRQLVQRVAG